MVYSKITVKTLVHFCHLDVAVTSFVKIKRQAQREGKFPLSAIFLQTEDKPFRHFFNSHLPREGISRVDFKCQNEFEFTE